MVVSTSRAVQPSDSLPVRASTTASDAWHTLFHAQSVEETSEEQKLREITSSRQATGVTWADLPLQTELTCLEVRPSARRPLLLVGDKQGDVSLWSSSKSVWSSRGEADQGDGQLQDGTHSLSSTLKAGARSVSGSTAGRSLSGSRTISGALRQAGNGRRTDAKIKTTAVCWDPGGNAFAAAREDGLAQFTGRTNEKESNNQKQPPDSTDVATSSSISPKGPPIKTQILLFSVYDIAGGSPEDELLPKVWTTCGEQTGEGPNKDGVLLNLGWSVAKMCFCGDGGRCLAIAEAKTFHPRLSIFDVQEQQEQHSFTLTSMVQCLGYIAQSACLAITFDARRIMLWELPPPALPEENMQFSRQVTGDQEQDDDDDRVYVDYRDGEIITAKRDLSLDLENLLVQRVALEGPAYAAGVESAADWLVLGWSNEETGEVVRATKAAQVLKKIAEEQPVTLVFQRPPSQMLPHATQIHCLAVSSDGACLAVGCEHIVAANSSTSTTANGGGPVAVSVWSVEGHVPWCSQDLHLRHTARALCWVDNHTLLVAHDKVVTAFNVDSGQKEREWVFQERVALLGFLPGQNLVASAFGEGRSHRSRTAPAANQAQARISLFPLDTGGAECVVDFGTAEGTGKGGKAAAAEAPAVATSPDGSFIAFGAGYSIVHERAGGAVVAPAECTRKLQLAGQGITLWPFGAKSAAPRLVGGSTNALGITALAVGGKLLAACMNEPESADSTEVRHVARAFDISDVTTPKEIRPPESDNSFPSRLTCVACWGATPLREGGAIAAGGSGDGSQGFIMWLCKNEGKCMLHDHSHDGKRELKALVFVPGEELSMLVGAFESQFKRTVVLWSVQRPEDFKEVRYFSPNFDSVRCLAVSEVSRTSPWRLHSIHTPGHTEGPSGPGSSISAAPPQKARLAMGGISQLAVHDIPQGHLQHSLEGDLPPGPKCEVTALRFSKSAELLVAGDKLGRVCVFDLRGAVATRTHWLTLGGPIRSLAVREAALARAVCVQESSFLVYDMTNPSLGFVLPDLQFERPPYSEKDGQYCGLLPQLSLLRGLVQQRLLRQERGWTILHIAAGRGWSQHVKALIEFEASPLVRDVEGRNAIDVALDCHEFGVVDELLSTLVERAKLPGRGAVARGSPADHLALTNTVVRLLQHRILSLPEFLDVCCRGTPRLPLGSGPLPERAALVDKELCFCESAAPTYRGDAPELHGLAPMDEERQHRPATVRVWYLRGALDRQIGLVPALKRTRHKEILCTSFVFEILEYKWRSFGRGRFLKELLIYLSYLTIFTVWCMTGAGQIFEVGSRIVFTIAGLLLLCFTIMFMLEESKQLWSEAHRGTETGFGGFLWAAGNYFNPWNVLDLLRIFLVGFLVIWSWFDRDALFAGHVGRSVLAMSAVVVWFRLISFFRGFHSTSDLVLTLITIIEDMPVFLVLLAVVAAAFSHAHFLLFGLESNLAGILQAMMFVYINGVVGDPADPPEGFDGTTPTEVFLYVASTLMMLVVIMNFLIAFMGDSYNKVREDLKAARNQSRAELIYEIENMMPAEAMPSRSYLFTCQEAQFLQDSSSDFQSTAPNGAGHQLSQVRDRVEAVEKKVDSISQTQRRICDALEQLLEKTR